MEPPLVCLDVVGVSRLLGDRLAERMSALGVSIGQLPTLLALYENDGQTQAELARATNVEQPTMAVNLRRMERDGLVERVPDPADRRRALVHLSPRARTIRDAVQAQRALIDETALDGVSPADLRTLRRVLAAMTANLSSAGRG